MYVDRASPGAWCRVSISSQETTHNVRNRLSYLARLDMCVLDIKQSNVGGIPDA